MPKCVVSKLEAGLVIERFPSVGVLQGETVLFRVRERGL